ncbi:MAG: Wss1p-related putative metallopeptidase [Acidiferrobacterales bacterium]
MVFAYYKSLSTAKKRIYRRSDKIHLIRLAQAVPLRPRVVKLERALKTENKQLARSLCQRIADDITSDLEVPKVHVDVLAVRPHDEVSELHGLYTREEGRRANIRLWIRTAERKKIVAFRTFLRTLLHELCHHLDYELLKFPDSLHTEGFYKRLSSLFNQLVPPKH